MSIRRMAFILAAVLVLIGGTAGTAQAHAAYTYNSSTGEQFGVSLLENSAQYNDGIIKACDRAADGRPLVAISYKKTAYGWKEMARVQDSYGGDCDKDFNLGNADGHRAGLRFPDGSVRHLGAMSTGGH